MTGWRTALRVAWREAKRAKGRAALVIAMITLPVAALAFGAVIDDTFRLKPQERAERLMGTAQAVVSWPSESQVEQVPNELYAARSGFTPRAEQNAQPTTERLLALLPPGTTTITDQSARLNVQTATGIAAIDARLLDYSNPLAHGIYTQLSGRAPATADEVALTPAATRRLNAAEGGTVRLAGGSRSFRVVGLVEAPNFLDATTIVLRPNALPATTLSAGLLPEATRQNLNWLVATPGPLTWDQVKQLNMHGVIAVSRHVLANPPSPDKLYPDLDFSGGDIPAAVVLLVGGLALLEIVLLAGPAFAVGARRRRRDLALVAAAGGAPAHVRRIVLADGVVLGALAAIVGVALGIAAAAAGRPLVEEHLAHVRSGAFRVFPEALAGLAGLAVLTGVLAALVPAWISSRQDVVTALAGRRGITRSRRRWVVLGAAVTAAGVSVTAVGAWQSDATIILGGLVVGELGLVLCTPLSSGWWLGSAAGCHLRHGSRCATPPATERPQHRPSRP